MACNKCLHFDMCDRSDMKNCPHFKDRSQFVKVVHGVWLLESESMGQWGGHTRYCNHCKNYYTDSANEMFFCPNCGTKMIGIEYPDRYEHRMGYEDAEWMLVPGSDEERLVKMRTEEDFQKINKGEPDVNDD